MPSHVTPWTAACQAPLSMDFSRQEYWSGLPFPSPPSEAFKNGSFFAREANLCLTPAVSEPAGPGRAKEELRQRSLQMETKCPRQGPCPGKASSSAPTACRVRGQSRKPANPGAGDGHPEPHTLETPSGERPARLRTRSPRGGPGGGGRPHRPWVLAVSPPARSRDPRPG